MRVRLLYFDDCPSWRIADGHLSQLAAEFGLQIERLPVETPEAAERLRFHGSPSIIAEGKDLFAPEDAEVGLSCRVYQPPDGPAGSPTIEQVREALTQLSRG